MIKKSDIKTGDVFKAYNKYMNPPKEKFHLCINEEMYFLINTKPSSFSCLVTPEDCSLLSYDSYINCSNIRIEPISEFKIIKKEQLSQNALRNLIKKVQCSPTLTNFQIKRVVSELNKAII